jgi:hypothetical protein
MNEKIEQLAREKDFAALSAAERNLVLEEIPESAYTQLRAVLLSARSLDSDRLPSEQLRNTLLAKMARQSKPTRVSRIWTARMPVWQAAAAVLMGIALVSSWRKEVVQERIVTNIEVRTDTVFQEKTIWRERIVWKEKQVVQEKQAPEPIALTLDKQPYTPDEIVIPQTDLFAPHVGTSLGDAPELMRFFTLGDK